jgi:hypothetical protein
MLSQYGGRKVHDQLYSNDGGAETAMRLRAIVREKLAAVLPAIARSGRYQIVIKIFACLKRLSCHVIDILSASRAPKGGHHTLDTTCNY